MKPAIQLFPINAGTFQCDGGGLFGSVPKVLWSKHQPADERNMITIPMRCLLVVVGERKILIETGAGDKLSEKFIRNNGVNNKNTLMNSIRKAGVQPEEITDVLHTHLHWDHCGGSTFIDSDGQLATSFPNATYHCSKAQWENALHPNPREADAYFNDDLLPVNNAGQLNLIEQETELTPGVELRIFNGHTPGQIIPFIHYQHKTVAYVSDLVPTTANIPIKWIASYDLFPVTTMKEKQAFLKEAAEKNLILFFEHDLKYECATVNWDETKGPKLGRAGNLTDFL